MLLANPGIAFRDEDLTIVTAANKGLVPEQVENLPDGAFLQGQSGTRMAAHDGRLDFHPFHHSKIMGNAVDLSSALNGSTGISSGTRGRGTPLTGLWI
jgi:hypothetical protein